MKLEVATQSLHLAPGEQVSVDVRVLNDGVETIDVVLGVAGLDAGGVRPVAELGLLPPGSTATTTLHFALPKGAVAGMREVAIHADDRRATAVAAEQSRQIARLAITVGSTEMLSLSMQRAEVRGMVRGKLRADLRNQGSVPLTLRLWGEGDDVAIHFDRDVIELPPGHSARVKGTVRIPGVKLRGDQRRAFVVTAQGASTPATTTGSYVKRGVLPASLLGFVAVLVVLALWITGLVYFQSRLRDTDSSSGVLSIPTTTTSTGTSTPGSGSTPAGPDGEQAAPGGTPGAPGPGESGGETPGVVEVASVPVSIIGAVDGPTSKVGTSVVLELLQLGKSSAGSGASTMMAPFASVAQAAAPISATQSTSTDDTGRFRFNSIAQSVGLYRITVFRTGFDVASQVVNIDGTQASIDLAIKLNPAAGRLGGQVVDGAGVALGGVAVSITSGDLSYSTTTADGTGSWELRGVTTPATYVIQFAKQGYGSASLIQPLDGGGVATGLSATMKAGLGTVRGLVQVDGDGVGGLTITIDDGKSKIVTTTRTDDPIGFFEFPGLSLGDYALTISGDGYQPSARQVALVSNLKELGVIDDLVRSTATIRGAVTQEAVTTVLSSCVLPQSASQPGITQQPCGGVGVIASQGTKSYRTTSASGNGSFVLSGIPPGNYTMTFERFGYTPVVFATDVGLGGIRTLDQVKMLVLPRSVEASGRLLLRVDSADPLLSLNGSAVVLRQVRPAVPFTALPGNAAAFFIPDLLSGSWEVKITADGHEDLIKVGVQVPLNAVSDEYALTLTPLGSVRGALTDQIVGGSVARVPYAVVFMRPVNDTTGRLLVVPPGTPLLPDQTYLRSDPAVGAVRLCEKNVAAVGAAPQFVRGLCTRADSNGDYSFPNATRIGDYIVSAPANEVGGALSEALDYRSGSVNVSSVALNTVVTADLLLTRLGAITGTISTVDQATGTNFTLLTGATVTAYFCEPTVSGCAFPASSAANNVERGRHSSTGVGLYRVDRLAPSGFDAASDEIVDKYLLRFAAAGYETEFRVVAAPALDTDAELNVVMLPAPTKVAIRPYWSPAGTTDKFDVPGATVKFTGIVSYSNARPPIANSGSVTDIIPAAGVYDSGDIVFRAGVVQVEVVAPGFATLTSTVSLDPSVASGVEVENLLVPFPPDPANPSRLLASGDMKIVPTPRTVGVQLNVVCCSAAATFTPTAVAAVYAALEAHLTLDATSADAVGTISATGAVQFANVAPGAYSISFVVKSANNIDLTGHIQLPPATAVVVETTGNPVLGALRAVLQTATVSGFVTDDDENVPVSDATVEVVANGVTYSAPVTAGNFTLAVPDVPGTYTVTIKKGDGRADCSSPSPLVFLPGAALVFSPRCAGPRGTVQGTVKGKANAVASPENLAGATVQLRRASDNVLVQTYTPLTETDGTFEFVQVPTGPTGTRNYVVVVSKTGYDVLAAVPVQVVKNTTARPTTDPIVLNATTRTVTVVVSSATQFVGAPVPLADVTVVASNSGLPNVSGLTDANGTVLLGLAPSDTPWTIRTTGAAGAHATLGQLLAPHIDQTASLRDQVTVTVPVGEGPLPGSTAVTLQGPFATVTGVVNGQKNPITTAAPLSGATVAITTSALVSDATGDPVADGVGVYLFSATVPVGFGTLGSPGTTTASVNISATGYDSVVLANQTLTLTAASATTSLNPVTLSASKRTTTVLVRDVDGTTKLRDVTVTATLQTPGGAPTGTTVSAVTDVNGSVTLQLVPGNWTFATSNGALAKVLGVLTPHGDVLGPWNGSAITPLDVQIGVDPASTTLLLAALVPVSGVVTSQPISDFGSFPAVPLIGSTITVTRVGIAAPPEPVNTYVIAGSPSAWSVLNGLTPGTWDIAVTAPGHDPASTQVVVLAGHPLANADLQLDEQPIVLSGTVFAGTSGVEGVTISLATDDGVVRTYTGTATDPSVTAVDGTYTVRLAASKRWVVGFDPSHATANVQNVPVLYRFVGPATLGQLELTLDHYLFSDLVKLIVTVRGALPGQCDNTSCVTHEVHAPATVTLTDGGNTVGGREAKVQFQPITTAGGAVEQVATFDEVPNLDSYSLAASVAGYATNSSLGVPLATGVLDYPCPGGAVDDRCVDIVVLAQPRDVTVTVKDLANTAVTSASVVLAVGGTSLACVTDVNGVCTVAGRVPGFGTYAHYTLTVNPRAQDIWGQYVQDLEVVPGVGAQAVSVIAVPVKPVITTPLANVAAFTGESNVFTATATGNPAPTVVWEEVLPNGSATVLTTDIVTSNPTSTSTTSSFSLDPISGSHDGHTFRATFSNKDGVASTPSTAVTASTLSVVGVNAATPADRTIWHGDNVSFSVETSGATPTYAWYRKQTGAGQTFLLQNGQTLSTLSLTNVNKTTTGYQYRAVVTVGGHSITSRDALLTVLDSGAISDPSNSTIWTGQSASFTSNGPAGSTRQWQQKPPSGSYADIVGQTGPTLTVASPVTGTKYKAVYSVPDSATKKSSAEATVTVIAAPINPTSTTVWTGTSVSLTTTKPGGTAVQWKESTDGGVSFHDTGTDSATLNLGAVTVASDANQYFAQVTTGTGAVYTTTTATLTVFALPANPTAFTTWVGGSATFTTTKPAGTTVVWKVSTDGGTTFTSIAASNIATLSLPGLALGANANQYQATVTIAGGASKTTTAALLTVLALPVNPVSVTVWELSSPVFTTTKPPGATVQWQANTGAGFGNVGLDSATFNLASALVADSGSVYRAIVTTASGVATTTGLATLTVAAITSQPTSTSVVAGSNATFTTGVFVPGGSTFAWEQSTNAGVTWTPIGTNSAVLTLSAVTAGMNGNKYRLTVTVPGAVPTPSVTTNIVTLTVT